MKKIQILLILLVYFCTSSNAGEFEIKLDAFTEIKARGNYKITLQKGDENLAKVINNDGDLEDEKFEFEVVGKVLNIRIKADSYKERDAEIIITYKTLMSIESYRGCKLTAKDELVGDAISLRVDTGGKIKASVKSKTLDCKIVTGGSLRVSGEADFVEYNISAGGTIAAIGLVSPNVLAKVKAGGEVICSANDILEIKIITGGTVSYRGNPKEIKEKVLGGTVEKLRD